MTDKEKQIEEMAKLMCGIRTPCENCRYRYDAYFSEKRTCKSRMDAECLYNAGYRKQREGEWKIVYRAENARVYQCSECGHAEFATSEYCICGAKMKGE